MVPLCIACVVMMCYPWKGANRNSQKKLLGHLKVQEGRLANKNLLQIFASIIIPSLVKEWIECNFFLNTFTLLLHFTDILMLCCCCFWCIFPLIVCLTFLIWSSKTNEEIQEPDKIKSTCRICKAKVKHCGNTTTIRNPTSPRPQKHQSPPELFSRRYDICLSISPRTQKSKEGCSSVYLYIKPYRNDQFIVWCCHQTLCCY